MSMYELNLPHLELVKVKNLHPEANSLVVIPIEISPIQESSGENGGKILVIVDNPDDNNKLEQFPLRFGKVYAVGKNVEDYVEGDTVYYHRFSGQDGDLLGKSILQIKQVDIMGLASIEYIEKVK